MRAFEIRTYDYATDHEAVHGLDIHEDYEVVSEFIIDHAAKIGIMFDDSDLSEIWHSLLVYGYYSHEDKDAEFSVHIVEE